MGNQIENFKILTKINFNMSVWKIAPLKLYLPIKPNQIENIFLQKFPSLIKLQRPDL